MKLYDFLKKYGIFANEIRQRLQSNQILVNGSPQDGDYDLGNVTHMFDSGFFLPELYKMPNYDKWSSQIMVIGLENLMTGESNIQNELTDYLKDYIMIQISKENAIFAKVGDRKTNNIIIHKEGDSAKSVEVEEVKEVGQEDIIAKLKSDKAKIDAQLSNPGFVKNAPQFKIDAAKKRLDVINSRLSDLGVNESYMKRFNNFK